MDHQRAVIRNGTAIAVSGADLHVYRTRGATYRLLPLDSEPLDHPAGVVWPATRLAALWLYGPDFIRTGEFGLAVAADLAQVGWAPLIAQPVRLPEAQPANLVSPGSAGVVIVVAGADDWTEPEIAWLLSNAVLHHPLLPARLVLTASSLNGLPSLRANLARLQSDVEAVDVAAVSPEATE